MKYLLIALSVLIVAIGAVSLWIGGTIIVVSAGDWYVAGTGLCLIGLAVGSLAKSKR